MRIMILNHQSKREGSPEYEARVAALLASYASPGTTIEVHYPEDLGGSEVTSHLRKSQALAGLHHALETPALVKKTIEAERLGFDAVVQSNTFDPGVEVARCAVRIPVVGVLRASCHFAATLCDRFGLIAPLDSHGIYARRIIENYRMGRFVSGIKAINTYEVGDLSSYHDLLVERMLAVGRELIAQGAQALIPLGGRSRALRSFTVGIGGRTQGPGHQHQAGRHSPCGDTGHRENQPQRKELPVVRRSSAGEYFAPCN